MFEKFTDRARRVVVLAQEEARRLNHNYIGTEHIFLGLIAENDGVAARALRALGVSLDQARREVEHIIGIGTDLPEGNIPFTPRAKKTLELSLHEAMQLGHNYSGTDAIRGDLPAAASLSNAWLALRESLEAIGRVPQSPQARAKPTEPGAGAA